MIKSIINNIIPDNIKDIKLVRDCLDVFLDYVVENSNIAIDTYNLYSDKNEVIYDDLLKVFIRNVYETIDKNKNNPTLVNKLDELYKRAGYKSFRDFEINSKMVDLIIREDLESSKIFQQTKGTSKSLEYVYNLVDKMNFQQGILESDNEFKFIEGSNVFEYKVEGSLIEELFEYFVKPIAHPVGWAYMYSRVYSMYFEDYILSEVKYDISSFYIGCLNQEKKDDFLKNEGYLTYTDENDKNIPDRFYLANGNPVENVTRHGNFYKKLDILSELKLVQDNEVTLIEDNHSKKDRTLKIYFKSGEYIESHTRNKERDIVLYYGTSDNPLNAKFKKNYNDFTSHCGLNLVYSKKVVTKVKDILKFQSDFGFSNTIGKLAVVGAGNFFVSDKIKGDQYKSYIHLGEKYLNENVELTYKTNVKNETNLVSNHKNSIKEGSYYIHRVLDAIEYNEITNDLKIYLNNYTLEDYYEKYILEVKQINNDFKEVTKNISEVVLNVKNFDKDKVFKIIIKDKDSNLHEEIKLRLKKLIPSKEVLQPNIKKYFYKNSYYYNNIVGKFTVNDELLDQYGKRIGNNGIFVYDEFEIELI